MAKIWVSRVSPYDFIASGITRQKVWFEKPHFKETLFICTEIGALDSLDYDYARWRSGRNNSISMKVMDDINPEFFKRVFKDTLSCYIPTPDDKCPYTYLDNIYSARERVLLDNLGESPSHEDKLLYANYAKKREDAQIQAEQEIELPNQSWRAALLEYDIDFKILS